MIQKYIISLPPITKKNSQQILTNHRTGKPFIAPSKQYKKYEQAAMWYLTTKPKTPLAGRYRVATVFYMPTRRKVDLTNLMEAAHDTLVAAKILADDNNTIIASVDGSRVLYDKNRAARSTKIRSCRVPPPFHQHFSLFRIGITVVLVHIFRPRPLFDIHRLFRRARPPNAKIA